MLPEPASSAGPQTFVAQICAELERRLRAREACRVEQFLSSYPELSSNPDAAVALIVAEFRTRQALGERIDPSEYSARFPQWRKQLEEALVSIDPAAVETAKETEAPSDSDPDGSVTVAPLGAHALFEEIGHGGMGIVYRARDLALGREVALKRIRSGALIGTEVDRFYREARAAAQLRHPNIVPIYAVGLYDGAACYTMPLVTGGTLADHLGRYHKDPRAAVTLIAKVAQAVEVAHRAGVVHRDLKPGNILLDNQGEPLVADFGLAKVIDSEAHMTRTGQAIGTPPYMAPEQLADQEKPIGAATDIWSLGIILFQLLTGNRPFQGRGRLLESQILHAEPVWPRKLPRGLGAIVLKCLEKAPAKRYAAAAELAEDLEAWRDGRPTRVRPARGVARVWRAVRRRPLVVLGLLFALMTTLAVVAIQHYTDPERELERLQEQAKPGNTVELIGATGGPRWYKFKRGESDAKAYVDKDNVFTVHGWPFTQVELFPDLRGLRNYVIHAEVRHIVAGSRGFVGLYFARTIQVPAGVPVHAFLYVAFDDLHDAAAPHRLLPPALKLQIPAPQGNIVSLDWRWMRDDDRPIPGDGTHFFQPELFKPSGYAGRPGDWRPLQIRVVDDQVSVIWIDQHWGPAKPMGPKKPVARSKPADLRGKSVGTSKPVGAVPPDETVKPFSTNQPFATTRVDAIEQKLAGTVHSSWIEQTLAEAFRKKPGDPTVPGLDPRPDFNGGVGLYLYESYAAWRNVRVEFLPNAAPPTK